MHNLWTAKILCGKKRKKWPEKDKSHRKEHEWAARQFYSLGSIIERMARSRTGLWWNIPRNVGYHLALRNFGNVGFNPECLPEKYAVSQPEQSQRDCAFQPKVVEAARLPWVSGS